MNQLPNIPTDEEINKKLQAIEEKQMHISFKELIKDIPISDIEMAHQHNLEILLERINKVRVVWAKPMIVTSGYRTQQDQFRIYRSRGYEDSKIPMGSQHLVGGACDISDPDGSLMKWTKDNEKLLEEVGLWVEDDSTQPRVHFQIVAPKSGKRFFKP